jgi:hypothetical protein
MIGPQRALHGSEPVGFRRITDLFRRADLGFANAEGSIFDLKSFSGYPAAETGGGYPAYEGETAKDIRAAGIRLVSKANNHVMDWGPPGGQTKQLPDEWYETVVPVSIYTNARLSEIRLYPAVIESSGGPAGGLPRPADAAQAMKILQRMKGLSARFGTVVSIEGSIGIIRPVYDHD